MAFEPAPFPPATVVPLAFQVEVVVLTTLPFNAQASVWMPVVGAAVRVEPGHKVPVMVGLGLLLTVIVPVAFTLPQPPVKGMV